MKDTILVAIIVVGPQQATVGAARGQPRGFIDGGVVDYGNGLGL
jgi:hypothetical protein